MACEILVGYQANYHEVRQRSIVCSVEIMRCNVSGDSNMLDLNIRINELGILLESQIAYRKFWYIGELLNTNDERNCLDKHLVLVLHSIYSWSQAHAHELIWRQQ